MIASMYSTGVQIVARTIGTYQLPLSLYLFCVMTVVVAPTTTRVYLVCRQLPDVNWTQIMPLS